MSTEAININDIRAAAKRIKGHAVVTPLLESPFVNELAGRRVLVKAECLQRTGAFKFRGAWSALSALDETTRARGVVAFSSGNHAQAVAHAATLLNTTSVIVMPKDAPSLKIQNTKALGAEVVLYDRLGGESREEIGTALANDRGLTLIQPFDNPTVMAGQGTCGLEIAQQAQAAGVDEADVLVCCGGGGLTAGIAIALESEAPGYQVRPVEPDTSDDVCRSLQSGQREQNDGPPASICDAIVTPSPGELTFPILKRLCGPGVTITDHQSLKAMAVAMQRFKLIAEPGGAAALAASLYNNSSLQRETVICTISGGNADPKTLVQALGTLPN